MTDSKKQTLVITGAAGYVGAMLVEQFAGRDDVAHIVGIDTEPAPERIAGTENLTWIQANTADGTWQADAAAAVPTIVIHAAWQIREMYGKQDVQWRWNVDGSDAVFDFAFATASVTKLIYFSTAAVYGAEPDNTIEHRFTEEEPMREDEYLYGIEKRVTEERLQEKWNAANADTRPAVFIVRPAAITGPRGRFMRIRFGLQSALSGQLKDSFVYRLVSALVAFIPATPKWCRQFIHEDDVTDIIALLAFNARAAGYAIYNIVPPGAVVRARDMAAAVGKRILPMPPVCVRIAFFIFWHGTRGKIPTSRGGWKFYSYPVVMDGTKLTREQGYTYAYASKEAFEKIAGRYAFAAEGTEQD